MLDPPPLSDGFSAAPEASSAGHYLGAWGD